MSNQTIKQMAYIKTEEVKAIREKLKATFPKVKFSLTREHYSSVRCCVMESPFEFEKNHMPINHHAMWMTDHHKGKPYLSFLLAVAEILTEKKVTESFDGDYGAIPNYYVTLQIGQWDKPHVTNKSIVVKEYKCLNCGVSSCVTPIKDGLGVHGICPKCKSSFDLA
jgi:hypothetical protein